FRWAYATALPVLWAIFFLAYRRARRRGRERPDAAKQFFLAADRASGQAGTQTNQTDGWNKAGFARPLAGYMTLVATMSFMVGAYLVLQWVLTGKVQPF